LEGHLVASQMTRDVTEPANIRFCRMRICLAIKITGYYGYCNST